jgi:uncharacterized protein (DUF433 family)
VKEFLERRDGSFYIMGSRVPLAIIVHDFKNGDAPETTQSNFPTLSLEQVYGAITFYLGNKEEVERDLIERRRTSSSQRTRRRRSSNKNWTAHGSECWRSKAEA